MTAPADAPTESRRTPVTVIATVLNEDATIDVLLTSLLDATRLPDAIVVVDGGSTDDTVTRLRGYADRAVPLEVIVLPGCSIASGRNAAFEHVRTPWVAVTDAGVRLSPGWLAALMGPVEQCDQTTVPEAVAGFFVAEPHSLFERALGATTLPLVDEVNPTLFLPSSRSFACARRVWAEVGGYPEWLDYGEDLVFDLRLKLLGARFAWAPDALVHFRPRRDLGAFWRQYYRYARGDGKADLWRGRHLVRYVTYLSASLAAALAWRHARGRLPLLALVAVAGAGYVRRPAERVAQAPLPLRKKVAAWALLPLLRLSGDLAKMCGYPVGVVWRLRQRPPRWR